MMVGRIGRGGIEIYPAQLLDHFRAGEREFGPKRCPEINEVLLFHEWESIILDAGGIPIGGPDSLKRANLQGYQEVEEGRLESFKRPR